METTPVLGYNVFSSRLDAIDPEIDKLLINTFSPNSYGLALSDKKFETALKNTDVLVLDGIGIALGSIILHGKNIKKISGQDCFDHYMAVANNKNWKVYFLGSSEQTLKKITDRVKKEYPNVITGTYSPPFKPEFSEEDNNHMVNAINAFKPDVLFVGLTAPKQEKWAYQHRNRVNARIISTIGNVFDWYAGNSKRPAKIWIDLRLEWLVRIFLRPEIFKRNTGNQLKFLRDLFLHITYIKRIKA
ncbi:MAG: WecB/TagA/CpsF family glycosyltransferase [Ferruginibacter sp.]|nr:WecB/TagA/CpsF family glycosyltransferase [Ferruginibacter sp.]